MKNPIEALNLALHERPRGDRIVVLPLAPARTGLIVDAEANRDKPERGIVLAVGPGGVGAETGRDIPVLSQVGELVTHGKYAGMAFEVTGPRGALRAIVMRDCEVMLSQAPGEYEVEAHDGDPRKMHLVGQLCADCPTADLSAVRDTLRADGLLPRTTIEVSTDDLIEQERARVMEPSPLTAR